MFVFMQIKKKLMVSDKKFHKAFRIHKKTKPIREFFNFTLPKLYIYTLAVRPLWFSNDSLLFFHPFEGSYAA